jgi:hypothetical protein
LGFHPLFSDRHPPKNNAVETEVLGRQTDLFRAAISMGGKEMMPKLLKGSSFSF